MRSLTFCASALLFFGCQRVDSTPATSLDDHAAPNATARGAGSSSRTSGNTAATSDGAPNVATPDATTPPPDAPLAPASGTSASDAAAGGQPAIRPDNTAVNERDRDASTKTPFDQGENEADRKTTAEIRQKVVNAENMSISARNVKIITSGGRVTLRGPVNSAAEHDSIVNFAREIAGENNVDDQLEVATGNNAATSNP